MFMIFKIACKAQNLNLNCTVAFETPLWATAEIQNCQCGLWLGFKMYAIAYSTDFA